MFLEHIWHVSFIWLQFYLSINELMIWIKLCLIKDTWKMCSDELQEQGWESLL